MRITRKKVTILCLISLILFFVYTSITVAMATALIVSISMLFVELSIWLLVENILYMIEKRAYLKTRHQQRKIPAYYSVSRIDTTGRKNE